MKYSCKGNDLGHGTFVQTCTIYETLSGALLLVDKHPVPGTQHWLRGSSTGLLPDGSNGSSESRESDLKRALKKLGSLGALRSIYDHHIARWEDEMGRISDEQDSMCSSGDIPARPYSLGWGCKRVCKRVQEGARGLNGGVRGVQEDRTEVQEGCERGGPEVQEGGPEVQEDETEVQEDGAEVQEDGTDVREGFKRMGWSTGGIRVKAGGMGGALEARREVLEAREGMPEHEL
ncbi:hypothetical protein DFH29DRAFT_883649 [Suillus ampliporus]|nr:hypothetical protein DFH29DRAFT_883649 [Suillus ampliporus]